MTNDSDCQFATLNVSNCTAFAPVGNLWCLTLVLFPLTCIFGNSLVVYAVLREKSLQTSTNYLLVSLAAADLLVASLVMPFSVYLTVNGLYWFLPEAVCNFFCVVDVSASTSSIVHLVAISVDRFYAVVKHVEYQSSSHKTRVYSTIVFCWMFSATIGLPLGIGLNQKSADDADQEFRCGIVNPTFMLYSSIFAFYIPCAVMLIMYGFVFYRLHKRLLSVRLQEMAAGRMVNFGTNLGEILQGAHGESNNVGVNAIRCAMPFIKTLKETMANMAEDEDISIDELNEFAAILQTLEVDKRRGTQHNVKAQMNAKHGKTKTEQQQLLTSKKSSFKAKRSLRSAANAERNFKRRRTRTIKDRTIDLLMRIKSKQGLAVRKETRATKLVATVLLIFLVCYIPFFTTNIVKVFKLRDGTWTDEMETMFVIFSWFGYVNSCINPVIYSLFNRKFRLAFRKILHCGPQTRTLIHHRLRQKQRLFSVPNTFNGTVNHRDSSVCPVSNSDANFNLKTTSIESKQCRRDGLQSKMMKCTLLPTMVEESDRISNEISLKKPTPSVTRNSLPNLHDLHSSGSSSTISDKNHVANDDTVIFANLNCTFTEAIEV